MFGQGSAKNVNFTEESLHQCWMVATNEANMKQLFSGDVFDTGIMAVFWSSLKFPLFQLLFSVYLCFDHVRTVFFKFNFQMCTFFCLAIYYIPVATEIFI